MDHFMQEQSEQIATEATAMDARAKAMSIQEELAAQVWPAPDATDEQLVTWCRERALLNTRLDLALDALQGIQEELGLEVAAGISFRQGLLATSNTRDLLLWADGIAAGSAGARVEVVEMIEHHYAGTEHHDAARAALQRARRLWADA